MMAETDVDNMDMEGAYDWLENRGIQHLLESLDEMRELIRRTIQAQSNDFQEQISEKVENALFLEISMKQDISDIYTSFIDVIDVLPSDVKKSLQTCFGDVRLKLISNRQKLQEKKSIIVVAGETSAGKSSFLNLLLKENVLPVMHAAATSSICRIHPIPPNAPPYFEVQHSNGHKQCYRITESNKKEMLMKFKEVVTKRDDKHENFVVDLYWQIPLVGKNYDVIIVDTPGVGESNNMSDKLFDYLPNATAFIYIINSANAGGVQKDKLMHILKKMYEVEETEDLFRIDPNSILFVCNKWDVIEETSQSHTNQNTTEEQVMNATLTNLRQSMRMEHLSWEKNLYKMSTTQAHRYLQNKMGLTKSYKQVLDGLGQLIVASQAVHSKRHFRWLEEFVKHIMTHCTVRISRSGDDVHTKQTLMYQTERKLKQLKHDSSKVQEELVSFCKPKCKSITAAFHAHTHSVKPKIISEVANKSQTISEFGFDDLKTEVINLIHTALSHSLNNDIAEVTRAIKDIDDQLRMKLNTLAEDLNTIQLNMQGGTNRSSDLAGQKQSVPEEESKPLRIAIGTKVTIGLTSPIWIPIGAVALLITLPIVFVKYGLIENYKINAFQKDPSKTIAMWLESVLEESFTLEALEKMVERRYMAPIRSQIDKVFKTIIPSKIKAHEIILEAIVTDRRSAARIMLEFSDTKSKLVSITEKMIDFQRKYDQK